MTLNVGIIHGISLHLALIRKSYFCMNSNAGGHPIKFVRQNCEKRHNYEIEMHPSIIFLYFGQATSLKIINR